MTIDERKNLIMELVKKNGTVKVAELSKLLETSEVTVRNYLADMEKKGLLSRIHGGAISSYKPYYSMNMSQRLETNQTEKTAIAKKIAEMIGPNDTIMMNAGTTTLLTFRMFPADYSLCIVTNSIPIVLEASDNPNYNVVLLGGSVNTKYQFSYGHDATEQLEHYHANKLILSVDGINPQGRLSTYYNQEANVDRVMLRHSDMCIVAADYTKFGQDAFVTFADLSAVDCLVTNRSLASEFTKTLQKKNIDLVFA